MKNVETFSLHFLNQFGLSCYRFKNGILEISENLALKNYLIVPLILITKFVSHFYIDLQIFLPEGASLKQFTSFSISMYTLLALSPVLTCCYIIFNHQKKRKEILSLMASIEKFNEKFIEFTKSETFSVTKSKFLFLIFIYLVVLRLVDGILSMNWNFWVIFSYAFRVLCETTIVSFIFIFTVFIDYVKTLLKNLNQKIKDSTINKNFKDLRMCSEFYEDIFNLIASFYKIFGHQIFILSLYITTKLILQVCKLES